MEPEPRESYQARSAGARHGAEDTPAGVGVNVQKGRRSSLLGGYILLEPEHVGERESQRQLLSRFLGVALPMDDRASEGKPVRHIGERDRAVAGPTPHIVTAAVYIEDPTQARCLEQRFECLSRSSVKPSRVDDGDLPASLAARAELANSHGGLQTFERTLDPEERDVACHRDARSAQRRVGQATIDDGLIVARPLVWIGPRRCPAGQSGLVSDRASPRGGEEHPAVLTELVAHVDGASVALSSLLVRQRVRCATTLGATALEANL
jgi:hypothetical protein